MTASKVIKVLSKEMKRLEKSLKKMDYELTWWRYKTEDDGVTGKLKISINKLRDKNGRATKD